MSGILEDDEGWFVAQLTTNQNETIGRDLSEVVQMTVQQSPFSSGKNEKIIKLKGWGLIVA